jgi:hypothetical protein
MTSMGPLRSAARAGWAGLGLLLMAGLAGCPRERAAGAPGPVPLGQTVEDPVSGARCVRGPETEAAVYMDRNHYFCDPANRLICVADPGRYADAP